MSHLVKDNNTAYELEFSQQDNSRNYTANAYRFPSRGFALSYHDYGYRDVLGIGFGCLQFTKFNILQHKKFGCIDFRIGSGVAFISKEYDVITNPKNNAIGSKWNAYINLQLGYEKQFGHFVVGAGLEMSHYSNAAITMPNLGLNTPMCYFKLGYAVKTREIFSPDTNSTVEILPRPANKLQFHVVSGIKQNLPGYDHDTHHAVIALQGFYRIKLGFKWDIETGTDICYNGANRYKYDDRSFTFFETVQVGLYAGACVNFYKSQIFFGLGGYIYNAINPAGWIYDRIGYRYNFSKQFNAMIAIKANIGIADYLEFGIGYRFW